MEVYLLKSAACLAILFVFYKAVLENTSQHTTKRFYLLGSLLLSLTIPFITFTQYVEVSPITPMQTDFLADVPMETVEVAPAPIDYLPYLLWTIYAIGVIIFSIRFGRNLYSVFQKIRKNPSFKNESILYVLLNTPTVPHSFFNYIFFSKKEYEDHKIPKEVVIHEEAHVKQKHSWDILTVELIRILFWFNPLVYFFKKSIRLNHEFLADHAVLQAGTDTSLYQNILLHFSSPEGDRDPSIINLAHSFNYSSIKKRFTVMKTQTSKRALWLRSLLILPLLAFLVYGFSTTEVVEKSTQSFSTLEGPVNEEGNLLDSNTFVEVSKDKVTPNQLETYNHLAEKYNAIAFEERNIPLADLKILETVYGSMSDLQKENAQPFPECLPKNQNSWQEQFADAYQKNAYNNGQESLIITVNVSKIMVNGKVTSLDDFAVAIDEATRKWTAEDFKTAEPSVLVAATPSDFMKKLDAAFKETKYYQYNGRVSIIPTSPPPAPPVPPVPPQAPNIKGTSNQQQLPPPPPPPSGALGDVLKKYKNSVILYVNKEDIYLNGKKTPLSAFANELDEHVKGWEKEDFELYGLRVQTENVSEAFRNKINEEYRKSILAKKSSRKNPYIIGDKDQVPPPPPPPSGPSEPLDHVVAMAKRNATFYFEKDKISSDRAIELIKENPDLHLQTRLQDPKPPKVYISKKPITVNGKGTGSVLPVQSVNGLPQPVSRSQYVNNLKVMNRHGASFYINKKEVTYDVALKQVKQNLDNGVEVLLNSTFSPDVVNIKIGVNQPSIIKVGSVEFESVEDPITYATQLAKQGATFYLGPHSLSLKEVVEMLQKNKTMTFNVNNEGFHNPIVTFQGC